MATKEHIVSEIRRIADELGRPPGRQIFEKKTGVRQSEWYGVYWATWGAALEEAGYEPNQKQERLSSEHLLLKYALVIRHFGRVPSEIELRMFARQHSDFPGHSTFANHFGSKSRLVTAFANWARQSQEYGDLVELLPTPTADKAPDTSADDVIDEGLVYMLKSGEHYKIGRSRDIERRVKQISIALPEDVVLVHTIQTDDPVGIEAYWHRRFSDKRANGEWFRLAVGDVRAFKRRRFQ